MPNVLSVWRYMAVNHRQLKRNKKVVSFEVWLWRKYKVKWTDKIRNEEMLSYQRIRKESIERASEGKAFWVGHVF